MKTLAVLSLFIVAVMSQLAHDGDIYDKFNMLELVKNDDRRNAAFACLMDRGPCGEYQLIRDVVPRILKTNCGDCSPAQKKVYDETAKYLDKHHAEQFKEMKAKYA